jgi:glucose/arabinose dehydrogenase
MRPRALFAAVLLAATLAAPAAVAADEAGAAPPAVGLRTVAQGLSQPLYLTAPPGDRQRLFIVEKTGRIRIVKNGELLPQPFLDLSGRVSTGGEQGLLSMAFHPRYASNGRFYVNYTNRAGDTRVVRYIASGDPDRADPGSSRVILKIDQPYANHNGGQLQFGPDGRLYVGMGDGGSGGDPQNRAQNPKTRLGKMLRIDLTRSPLRWRIYAKGLRNPWRFSFDRGSGALWIGDVGQSRREEIDRLRPGRPAGANLGWSAFEGTLVFKSGPASRLDRDRLVWPVEQYGHTVGQSVTGGYVYRGAAIPALRGWYVFGDFVSGRVWATKRTGDRFRLRGANGRVERLASFGEDAAGELYMVSLAGRVWRIVPAP